MSERTRAEYSLKNASTAMLARILSILFGYAARIVLTRTILADYVGINGLLSSMLGAMTLSEMGIDTALVYSLYPPAAQQDEEKQKSLIHLIRRIYLVIAVTVSLTAAAVYPLLHILMHTPQDVSHFVLIYALYVLNTASSYFCASKSLLFLANQRNYINDYFYSVFLIFQYVLQIILLIVTKNFIIYIMVQIACNVLKNAAASAYASKRYPWLKSRNVKSLRREEKHEITRNSRAMFIHKIGLVVTGNISYLCLTFFSGLAEVAKYTNYYLIIGSVRQIDNNIIRGISGSVGNLATEKDPSAVYDVFCMTLFAVNWLFGFCAAAMFPVLGIFVRMSFGEQYLFPDAIAFVLCLNFYLNGIRQAALVFRDSLGLFWYDRYKTIAESLVSLIFSVILARKAGTIGIFAGTTISIVSLSIWIEPLILYRMYFKKPFSSYMRMLTRYFCATASAALASSAACYAISSLFPMALWQTFLVRIIICAAVPNLVFFLLFHRSIYFRKIFTELTKYIRGRRQTTT